MGRMFFMLAESSAKQKKRESVNMSILKRWRIIKGDHHHLGGIVYGHRKLDDGVGITTSRVNSLALEGDKFIAVTGSGTVYDLEMAEMDTRERFVEDTLDVLSDFGFGGDVIELAFRLGEKRRGEYMDDAGRMLENGGLLLFMSGTCVTRAYFKSDQKVHECDVHVHIGMFRDSVLISAPGGADFRFFPDMFPCRIYQWSDGIYDVKIKNDGKEDVIFACDKGTMHIKESEVKSLDKEFHLTL